MMDRPTGSYTHERLIALEDSHLEMIDLLKELGSFQKKCPTPERVWDVVAKAYGVRKEAGL